jgi:hypothetical protein
MNASNPDQLPRDCLVAVVTSDDDLRHFTEERWYRIPERAIGRSLKSDALDGLTKLALYQTSTITSGLPSAIELWGEVDDLLRLPRKEFLPEEPHHPAADELYRLVRVRSVKRLQQPITSRRPRRVTFIRTTGERLFHAHDINDLVLGSPAEEKLWGVLKELDAERKYFMRAGGIVMEVDFAIFNEGGALGVICGGNDGYDSSGVPDAWSVLRFSAGRLESEFATCLEEIMATMRTMQTK